MNDEEAPAAPMFRDVRGSLLFALRLRALALRWLYSIRAFRRTWRLHRDGEMWRHP